MIDFFKKRQKTSFITYDDSETGRRRLYCWTGRIESTIGKYKWEWHQNDADHFPSFPHLHSMGKENLKMNIYTGELYDSKNKSINKNIGSKQLQGLWNDKVFNDFVISKREEYYNCIYDGKQFNDLPNIPKFN